MLSRRPYKTPDIIKKFQSATNMGELAEAAFALANEFRQPINFPTHVVPTVELVDTLLDAMIIKKDFLGSEDLYRGYCYMSESLHYILHKNELIQNNPDPLEDERKLNLKANVVRRLRKSLDSCSGTKDFHDYAAGVFRNLDTFFNAYPEHSNQPKSYQLLLSYVTGPFPLYPRIIALETLKGMVWDHPELANAPTGFYHDKDNTKPMSLMDIALSLSFGEDKWGDGKPIDPRFYGSFAESEPLKAFGGYLFMDLCHKRPQDITDDIMKKITITKEDRPSVAQEKTLTLLNMALYIGEKNGACKHIVPALVKAYDSLELLDKIAERDTNKKIFIGSERAKEGVLEHMPDLPVERQPQRNKASAQTPTMQPHPV